LINSNNLAYSGPVFLGTPAQGNALSDFIYDTGSGYLTVTTTGCTNCGPTPYYDPALSSSTASSTYTTTQLAYGSANLSGSMGADTVCLVSNDPTTCVTNFSFFKILQQTGLDGLDGILGLSPAVTGNGPSYMWTLYEQGKITSPECTFWMNFDTTEASSVTFGGVPPSAVRGEYIEQSLVKAKEAWWTVKMTDIRMGGTSIN
jgi:hypothetical protein